MMDLTLMAAIADSLTTPITFADTGHVIRYMNKAAIEQYAKRGGAALVGTSVLNCHNEQSQATILAIFEEMRSGLDERLISDTPTRRIYMRAVRDSDGRLVGYYERFEYPMTW
jgi:DUF438 domain-containing protein